MFIVRTDFTDMQDGGHKYSAGDTFPRAGFSPSAIRLAELSSSTNRLGEPLIEERPEAPQAEDQQEEKPRRIKKKTEPKE